MRGAGGGGASWKGWRRWLLVGAAPLLPGCGSGESSSPTQVNAAISLTVSGLEPLGATLQGRYEAWVGDRGGAAHRLGVLDIRERGSTSFTFALDGIDAASVWVAYAPPGTTDAAPPATRLLQGRLQDGRAELRVEGALTLGDFPLRTQPGQFTMFSPSDNHAHGYPSYEEAGVWLFNMAPRLTPQNDMWVRLAPLQPGWTYEGWMVRDIDAPGAIWLSYGKFLPDASGAVGTRDDTGWGPFSGVLDFRTAGEEDFPGDDWISNPLGFPFPAELTLPLDLREKDTRGVGRWTHVLTIEPATDRGEAIGSERPFTVRPYRDAFGDGAAGEARAITFRPEGVPRGDVIVR